MPGALSHEVSTSKPGRPANSNNSDIGSLHSAQVGYKKPAGGSCSAPSAVASGYPVKSWQSPGCHVKQIVMTREGSLDDPPYPQGNKVFGASHRDAGFDQASITSREFFGAAYAQSSGDLDTQQDRSDTQRSDRTHEWVKESQQSSSPTISKAEVNRLVGAGYRSGLEEGMRRGQLGKQSDGKSETHAMSAVLTAWQTRKDTRGTTSTKVLSAARETLALRPTRLSTRYILPSPDLDHRTTRVIAMLPLHV